MEKVKPYAILGMHRSGTTLAYSIIKDLSPDYNKGLGLNVEYFQLDEPDFYVRDTGKELIQTDGRVTDRKNEILRRLRLLKKYHYPYTLKCLPDQLPSKVIRCLLKNYRILYCERRDHYEQFLSYCIAHETGIWNVVNKQFAYDETKINIKKKTLNAYLYEMKNWYRVKKYITSKNFKPSTIWYEDLIQNSKKEITENTNLQWRDQRTEYYVPILKLANKQRKQAMIQNIDRVREYFFNLQKLRPYLYKEAK